MIRAVQRLHDHDYLFALTHVQIKLALGYEHLFNTSRLCKSIIFYKATDWNKSVGRKPVGTYEHQRL